MHCNRLQVLHTGYEERNIQHEELWDENTRLLNSEGKQQLSLAPETLSYLGENKTNFENASLLFSLVSDIHLKEN